MREMSVVSSANFRSLTEGSLDVQSFVYREKSSGERTQPWGAPGLAQLVSTNLNYRCGRGVQGMGCFFKSTIELIQIVCLLLILQSAGGWCLVTGDLFHTFPHWSRITGRELDPSQELMNRTMAASRMACIWWRAFLDQNNTSSLTLLHLYTTSHWCKSTFRRHAISPLEWHCSARFLWNAEQ